MEASNRTLRDLVSIGPAMLRGLSALGIQSVEQLAKKNPRRMYTELCRLKGRRISAVSMSLPRLSHRQRIPDLPIEQRQWWYWSKKRKASDGKG
jgi:hypothetical protein